MTPSWAALWISSACAWRTEEKVWSRSGGTWPRSSLVHGLRRQPQGDADLVHVGQCLGDALRGPSTGRLPPVELRPRTSSRRHQLLCPIEFELGQRQRGLALVEVGDPGMQDRDLVVDVLHGVLQFPALAPGLRFDAAHRGAGRLQIRLRRVDRGLSSRRPRPDRAPCPARREDRPCARGCCRPPEPAQPGRGRAAATKVTWPLTKASSVETVLRAFTDPRNAEPRERRARMPPAPAPAEQQLSLRRPGSSRLLRRQDAIGTRRCLAPGLAPSRRLPWFESGARGFALPMGGMPVLTGDLSSRMGSSVPSRSCPPRTPRGAWPASSRWHWR